MPDTKLMRLRDLFASLHELVSGEDPEAKLLLDKSRQRTQERAELIKKCHPDDTHWPPHQDCPACQKLFAKRNKNNVPDSQPEINLVIESEEIAVKTRKLKAVWSTDSIDEGGLLNVDEPIIVETKKE